MKSTGIKENALVFDCCCIGINEKTLVSYWFAHFENKTLILTWAYCNKQKQKKIGFIHTIARNTPGHGFDGGSDDVWHRRTLATDGCVG